MTGRTDSRRPIRTTSSTRRSRCAKSSANFRPALGFVQRDNVRLLRVGAQLQSAAAVPQHPADVPRLLLHAVHAGSTTIRWRAGMLYIALFDWHLRLGRQRACRSSTSIRSYERLFETFEISPGVFLPPGEYRFTRFRSNVGERGPKRRFTASFSVGTGFVLVGQRRAGHRVAELQAAAPLYRERVHEPDVRAAARRKFHHAHLHVEHRLHRFTETVVLQPHPVRQPLEESRMAEPGAVDAAARQRFLLLVQSGLDSGRAGKPPSCGSGLQDSRVSTKFQYSHRF